MHLCFVTNEIGKVPSGVVTVLMELCREWSDTDRITVITNRYHWANEFLIENLSDTTNITIAPFPWLFASELLYRTNKYNLPKWIQLPVKVLFRLLELFLAPAYIMRLTFFLRQNNFDGILNHNGGWPGGELNRWASLAAKLAGINKNFLVIHNTPVSYRSAVRPFNNMRDRLVGLSCGDIITVSHACRKSLEVGTGFKRKLRVIYDGIDVTLPQLKQSDQPPWPKKHLTIGFVGELHPRKGVHVLLDAVSRLTAPCEVVLVGNGDEEYTTQLKDLAGRYKWPAHFMGFRDDALELYRWLDIIVLPSLSFESFGMVLLEAMLWSKPTICSNFGGMKEVVVHEETGLVVPADDPEALAEALERLIKDEPLRNQMGALGRKRLEAHFSAPVMVKNYENLFHGTEQAT